MKLTGEEPWVIAGLSGETIWAKFCAKWWPICDVELDCGLIGLDISGKRQIVHLTECIELRIGLDTIVDIE